MAGQAFGKFPTIDGKGGSHPSTLTPLKMEQNIKQNNPIPITISGTSNLIFTVNASKTRPVNIWNGNDFIHLKETLAYTFKSTTNNVLHATTGAAATQTGVTASTVYYMYVGLDSTGTLVIRPSTGAPSYVEGPFEGGVLSHPGTARAQYWNYVGFVATSATANTIIGAEKQGYTYSLADTTTNTLQVATATTWAELDTSGWVPKHGPLGLTVGGSLETGAEGSVTVGNTSTATIGAVKASVAINTTTHTAVLWTPFSGITPTANGKVWGNHVTAAGDVHVTQITDVV